MYNSLLTGVLEETKLLVLVSEEVKEKSGLSKDVSIDLKLRGPEKSLMPDIESLLVPELSLQSKQTVVSHLLQPSPLKAVLG